MLLCGKSHVHILQTSSFNQTHVPVASNSISLSCLEGRIHIITLLNPLPVLVALKILQDILSLTRLFMINTRPLVGCLENSDRKAKQFRVMSQISPCLPVYCSLIQCPNLNVSGSATRLLICIAKLSRNRHCANRTAWLE